MLAQDICTKLKTYGFCKNDEEFSCHFLGKSDRYFSTVKAKGMELPLGSKTILAARLNHLIVCLSQSKEGQHKYGLTINALKGALRNLKKDIDEQSLRRFKDLR